jgi:hypothetical protein
MSKLEEFTLKVRMDLVRAGIPLAEAQTVQEKTLQAGKAFKEKVSEFAGTERPPK